MSKEIGPRTSSPFLEKINCARFLRITEEVAITILFLSQA
jgi:hypothetical protein